MTIKVLHDLFFVEYDKANSITTYPNFTHSEIDVWLNKSLLMLISQKFTGTNSRKVGFEGDSKRLSDLQKIVTITDLSKNGSYNNISNSVLYDIPTDFFLYVGGYLSINSNSVPTDLIEHEYIKLFTSTSYNSPWIKRPKVSLESDKIIVIFDSSISTSNVGTFSINYIKQPTKIKYISNDITTEFQFSDSVAEEVISLAVALALGNIESPKVNIAASVANNQE